MPLRIAHALVGDERVELQGVGPEGLQRRRARAESGAPELVCAVVHRSMITNS